MKSPLSMSAILVHSTKERASKNQTTIRGLVEAGSHLVLNDAQAKTQLAFKLKYTSVRGGEMLISDSRKWQENEDDHLASKLR
jgi:hypothetical protein